MGYQNGASGLINNDLLVYHTATLTFAGAGVEAIGIDPDGKTIHIYKLLVGLTGNIQYRIEDSAGDMVFIGNNVYVGALWVDNGLTPIPLATNNSDLYIRTQTATATVVVVNVWYTLR